MAQDIPISQTGRHFNMVLTVEVGHLKLWPSQQRAEWGGEFLDLTSTEFKLLDMLVLHAGQPVAKESLSEHVFGRELKRFDRNIDVHISNIRHKIGALSDGRSYIQSVYRQGYKFILD